MKVTCSCGRSYWPNQAWIHERCAASVTPVSRSSASNDATNGATNAETSGAVSERTLNRRKREDYNAYQRELMRKRRERARAGFEK